MATISKTFQDVFTALLEAPDKETRDKKIRYEQMMVADFIGTLNNVRNSDSREEGDAMLHAAMAGKYETLEEDLATFKSEPEPIMNARDNFDELMDLMTEHAGTVSGNAYVMSAPSGRHKRFGAELSRIKNAPKRSEGNKDIDALLTLMIDYASALVSIKNAPTFEAATEIIKTYLA